MLGSGEQLAFAGSFSLVHFVPAGEFALGLEPELILTHDAGIGVNVKYTHGITDLNNATVILGTGGGSRHFRVGTHLTFDFIPDLQGQPGIGIALQGLYYRLTNSGQLELTGIPYIHKTLVAGDSEIEPFVTVPLGMAFSGGRYRAMSQLTVGSMFKTSEHVRTALEFGIAVNNTESYVSGGIVYYH